MIESKKCKCNIECFSYIYYDRIVYKCNKIGFEINENNDFIENSIKPCDYYEEVIIKDKISFIKFPEKTKYKGYKINYVKHLKGLIKYFYVEKLARTHQEIDVICKKLKIPFNSSENIAYEETQKVLKYLKENNL